MSNEEKGELTTTVKAMPSKAGKIEMSPRKGVRQNMQELYQVAQVLFQSDMCPPAFKDAKQVMYALGMGQDLGFTNTQSLANITVINNKPSVYADGLPAILHRSGHFYEEEFSGTIEAETYTATIMITRKDTGNIFIRDFSVEDAKRAGLWQTEPMVTKYRKDRSTYTVKNDSPWYKYPKRMIWRRAIGWAVRDALADEMYGLHIVEEQEDHAYNMSQSAEPKTSKLAEKLSSMGKGPDDVEEPEYIDIDVEPEDDTPPEVNDVLEEADITAEESDKDTTDEDPPLSSNGAEGPGEDSPPLSEPGSSELVDEEDLKFGSDAAEWFAFIQGSELGSDNFRAEWDREQTEAWYLELEKKDRAGVALRTAELIAAVEAGEK